MPETRYIDGNSNGARPVVPIANGGGPPVFAIDKSATTTNSPSLASDFGTVTKALVKNATGNVYALIVTSISASLTYVQLHNKATAPAAADVPIYSVAVPAGTATQPTVVIIGQDFFGDAGKNFATGIGWAVSSTLATFTDGATAGNHSIYVHYA